MQTQSYEGYFDNGQFYIAGQKIRIPERKRIFLTILDESVTDNEHIKAWQDFFKEIKEIDDEPLSEFERVKFREVEI